MAEEVVFSLFSVISWCFSCFLNVLLVALVFYLLYKIIVVRRYENEEPETHSLPEMKRRDFTVEELRVYDGVNPESDGRILIAVNGNVFDVTKGSKYYGLGGPYSIFAGHDASRGLGTFNMTQVKDEYDDLSDLQHVEIESIKEWELQFRERYDLVGRLLKPGERHRSYSDEEDEDEEPAAAKGQAHADGDSKSKTE